MIARGQRLLVAAAALTVGATRFLFRARVPDDYDSIGFVRALDHFDVAKLQPHFPGYPVYVALGKAAHALIPDPTLSATLVSSLASTFTAVALYVISGPRTGLSAIALYGAAWLPWLLGGAALSETLAVAFAAAAFALVGGDGVNLSPFLAPSGEGEGRGGSTCSRREWITRCVLGGLAVGLMLGTRASYWPLALSFLVLARARILAATMGLALGLCLWLVPFAMLVPNLFALGRTHVSGHFGIWGGSIVTEPHVLQRLSAFARGIFYDGLAPSWPMLILLGVLVVAAWRFHRPELPRRVWWVAVPYALWALVAQNVIAQPRHLLPLVVMACLGLSRIFAARAWIPVAATALMLVSSLPLAWARTHGEPAAARAARWVAANYAPRDVVVIGARSMRFFGLLAPGIITRERNWLSEVDVEVTRLDRLPPTVLVTSELEVDADRVPRLGEAVTFCRDPRIDRGMPCLSLKPYRIGFATP